MSARPIAPLVAAAGAGLLFGLGLAVSRMIDPEKVKAFLDIAAVSTGGWDPSLAFVMGGGLITAAIFYRLMTPMRAPLFVPAFSTIRKGDIDRRLVIGSAVFGIGWGIAGLCPGPAIIDLGLAPGEFALFGVSMLVGSWAVNFLGPRVAATPRVPARSRA